MVDLRGGIPQFLDALDVPRAGVMVDEFMERPNCAHGFRSQAIVDGLIRFPDRHL
jgi:hypothetical protein